MPNVVFLHCGDNWLRGSENSTLTATSCLLENEGYNVLLLCNAPVLYEEAKKRGIDVILFPMPEIMIDGDFVRLQFIQWIVAMIRLCRIVKHNKANILYCNCGLVVQFSYLVGLFFRIPVLAHLHCPYNKRYIYLYFLNRLKYIIYPTRAIERLITGKVKMRADGLVVYFGVDLDKFMPASSKDQTARISLGIECSDIVFGQVGSLIMRKGVDLLIRAVAQLRMEDIKAHLVLVGDGDDRLFFESIVRECQIERYVHFVGYQKNTLRFYQHVFDVNCLASRSEAFGISMVEGAACGIPCLGARVDGIPETMIEGDTGLLFESNNVEDLTNKMRLFAVDNSLRRKMGQQAVVITNQRFSRQNYKKEITEYVDYAIKDYNQ